METLVQQKVTIKTTLLQELIGKAVKACSMVDAFIITGLLQITVKDNMITVQSTDNVNTLYLKRKDVEGELNIVVDAKLFSSLISKLTTPITEISVDNGRVVVKANGKYDFELVTEQDGSSISLPSVSFDHDVSTNHITNEQLRSIITINKSCKADMKEMPSLFNYYMDSERVLTTDFFKVCSNPIRVFNTPVCLPPELVDLIPLVTDDNGVDIQRNNNIVAFSSTNGVLYGKTSVEEDLDNYPVSDLLETVNESFSYNCIINRTLLVNALERLCLFTDGFDSNAVNMKFEADKVTLTTNKVGTHESIKFLQPSTIQGDFEVVIDATGLKQQLLSLPKEDITIGFGSESGIQIVCDNILQISGALGDEE